MIFGLFDQLFPLMFTVIFLIVIGTFIYTSSLEKCKNWNLQEVF